MLTNIATPTTLAPCDMATRRLAGTLPSIFTAKAGSRYGLGCTQLNKLPGVRAMTSAAQSDIPVNRSSAGGSSGAGASTAGSSGGDAGSSQLQQRQEDRAPARRGGRGRRGGVTDVVPFGGLGGGLLGDLFDPFGTSRSLRQMLDVVDRVFDDSLAFPFGRTGGVTAPTRGVRTPWDVVETDNEFHLRFDLPGFSKDEVKVTLEDNALIVSAEKKEGGDDKFARAAFFTRVELPENVKADEVKAQLKNGVLELIVPKTKHEPKRHEIDVQSSD